MRGWIRGGSAESADAFPEGAEVVVAEAEAADVGGVGADGEGAEEPLPAFVDAAELGGVAGEVVGDGFLFGELVGGGAEGVPGEVEAALGGAAEGVGAAEPAVGALRGEADQLFAQFDAVVPVAEGGGDAPAEVDGGGESAGGWGEPFPFRDGVVGEAEFEPAFRGAEVVGIGGGDGHGRGGGWVGRVRFMRWHGAASNSRFAA